ncbi:hypothetical protein A9Q83_17125 [Alphaproteobacteria bacterium 46_93_T64]|nr:hypothetical protein A9Q83_17125 [Alphaproteobacteria bacterium 46_93_T64]
MELLKTLVRSVFGGPSRKKTEDPSEAVLSNSIENAMLLILTASENAIILNREAVNCIIEAKNSQIKGKLDTKTEQEFWMAYEEIANNMLPINIDSIKATYDPDRNSRFSFSNLFKFRRIPLSRKCASNYKLLSLATLLLLIAIQIYWYIGYTLTTDINQQSQTIDRLNIDLENALLEEDNSQISAKYSHYMLLTSSDKITIKIKEHLNWKEAAIRHLENWNQLWSSLDLITLQPWQQPLYSRLSTAVQRRIQFVAAGNTLQALSEYILPILYGLIGACFFILRQLPKEIETLTFSMNSYISYSLRIAQGPLAGMMVSYFFTSEQENPNISATSGIQIQSLEPGLSTVSPLAVAFLAGYSIEFIFRFLDKILDSSTNKNDVPKEIRTPIQSRKKPKSLKMKENSE